jgi:TetR/AcrR family transcriptional regulator, cholesterol catabolism regulator
VPLARTGVDRAAKLEEILAAAERRLTVGGYDGMSIAAIARELGIVQNSIYWYFPSKDHLFVAVLRRLLARLATRKPPKHKGLTAQVLWATDQMHDLGPLRSELRDRAKQSDVVAEFNTELDSLVRRLLIHGIEPYLDPDNVDLAASTFLATVEGTFSLGLTKKDRHHAITYALEHIVGLTE